MSSALLIFLTVLKIIGIVLLSILGLLLFLIMIVLFVPVRYKADGAFCDNNPDVNAKVSWLLHIVSVSFSLNAEEKLCIRIFGFKLKSKKHSDYGKTPQNVREKKTKENRIKKNKKTESDVSADYGYEAENAAVISDIQNFDFIDTANLDVMSEDELIELLQSETVKEKRSDGAALNECNGQNTEQGNNTYTESDDGKDTGGENNKTGKNKKIKKSKPEKKKNTSDGTKIYDKIKGYMEVLQSDEFSKSFELSKKTIGKILKAILPKKWGAFGKVGFDDPEKNGKAAAGIGIAYPWLKDHINVYCDFDNPVIDISGFAQGRIYAITLVYSGLCILLNRNVRKTIKLFKSV